MRSLYHTYVKVITIKDVRRLKYWISLYKKNGKKIRANFDLDENHVTLGQNIEEVKSL